MPNLAIIANSLSPARASLAALVNRRAELELEAEPLNARLSRIDRALADQQRTVVTRDALRAHHDAAVTAAASAGEPVPEPSHELLRAEADLEAAERNAPALTTARESAAAAAAMVNERLGALSRELDDQA